MVNKDFGNCLKLDNEVILKLSGIKDSRRALLIYSYLSHIGHWSRALQTDIVKLVELMDVPVSTSSKNSIRGALEILVESGFISVYKDRKLINGVNLEEQTKRPKDTFWVKTNPSMSEKDFTLIPSHALDGILFSTSDEKPDDMFSVLAYICSKSERREAVSPIMWSGRNKMSQEIHMTGRKLAKVLDVMMELKIIYFKRAKLTGGRSNYVYGLYKDKSEVDDAVAIAEGNNHIDKRIKMKSVIDSVIDIVDGEFLIDIKLSNFFDRHGIDCNNGIVKETNTFYQKHGHAKLMSVLGDYNSEIFNADNKNGAYRGILRRNY